MTVEAQRCPNCGAPLNRNAKGECTFCGIRLQVSGAAVASPAAAAPVVKGDPNGPFELVVEDTFTIKGRGTVVTGTVTSGTVKVGDALVIDGPRGQVHAECKGIEAFRKKLDRAVAGDHVGLMLPSVEKEDVARGSRVRAR